MLSFYNIIDYFLFHLIFLIIIHYDNVKNLIFLLNPRIINNALSLANKNKCNAKLIITLFILLYQLMIIRWFKAHVSMKYTYIYIYCTILHIQLLLILINFTLYFRNNEIVYRIINVYIGALSGDDTTDGFLPLPEKHHNQILSFLVSLSYYCYLSYTYSMKNYIIFRIQLTL